MKKENKGQFFLEVLLSLLILSIILVGVLRILSLTPKITFYSEKNQVAYNLLNEYLNIALSFRYKFDDIKNLNPNQNHYFEINQGNWSIHNNDQEIVSAGGENYTRYFRVVDYEGNDKKLMTIYLSSVSSSENLQVIITEWQ